MIFDHTCNLFGKGGRIVYFTAIYCKALKLIMTVFVLMIVMVMVMDWLSGLLRARLIRGDEGGH